MSEPAVLIATAKVRRGKEDAFATWKAHHDTIVAKFPGFISSDIMPPGEHSDAWTIVLNFKSRDLLTDWQQSKERGALIAELLPLLRGGDIGEAMQREDFPSDATWNECHAGHSFENPARNGRRLQGLGCENSTGTIVVSRLSRDVSSATNIY